MVLQRSNLELLVKSVFTALCTLGDTHIPFQASRMWRYHNKGHPVTITDSICANRTIGDNPQPSMARSSISGPLPQAESLFAFE